MANKLTTQQRKAVFAKLGVAKVQGERNIFQVSSLSDPTQKSYFIDVHDSNLHKKDCKGARFAKKGKVCNHIKRLEEAGIEIIKKKKQESNQK